MWREGKSVKVDAKKGTDLVELKCLLCGVTKTAAITWKFEGGDLPEGTEVNDNDLHIRDVKEKHFGKYSCSVLDPVTQKLFAFDVTLKEVGMYGLPNMYSFFKSLCTSQSS